MTTSIGQHTVCHRTLPPPVSLWEKYVVLWTLSCHRTLPPVLLFFHLSGQYSFPLADICMCYSQSFPTLTLHYPLILQLLHAGYNLHSSVVSIIDIIPSAPTLAGYNLYSSIVYITDSIPSPLTLTGYNLYSSIIYITDSIPSPPTLTGYNLHSSLVSIIDIFPPLCFNSCRIQSPFLYRFYY